MSSKPYIPVDGTWGMMRQEEWSHIDSPFSRFMNSIGYEHISKDKPFWWTTDIDGLDGKNVVWLVGGQNLYYYVVPPLFPDERVPVEKTLIITFSHGAQVALHAFAMGMKGRLITVNPPVRDDMQPVIEKARPNILRWVNLYGNWKDYMAVLGALRDGHYNLRREFPEADKNILVPGGHGDALRDPKWQASWPGWLEEVSK